MSAMKPPPGYVPGFSGLEHRVAVPHARCLLDGLQALPIEQLGDRALGLAA